MVWPDLLILAVIALAVYKGFRRGFIAELSGAVAFFAALITPWFYNGAADHTLESLLHLGSGSAHVVGMFLTGLLTYLVVLALAAILNGIAKFPGLNIGNGILGACVGFIKGALLCWLVLYIALFFPLTRDIRSDLHRSQLASYLTQPDKNIDRTMLATAPWFVRAYLTPLFLNHHN